VRVHVFKAPNDLYGFTEDLTGANLPADRGPWTSFKSIEVYEHHPAPRIGVHESDVLFDIKQQGYHLTNNWAPPDA
jgi:hypothetical protein